MNDVASYLQDIQCIVQKTTRFLVELSFFKTYKGFTVENLGQFVEQFLFT